MSMGFAVPVGIMEGLLHAWETCAACRPLTVPIYVQAGVYPNVFHAARAITDAAGVRGLFTGYLPNLLEDVPDMAFKFAAYESMRSLHRRLNNGRSANVQVRLRLGA